jgi:hypothetical protein
MIALAEVNSRMKDFYDVYALSRTCDFDGRTLYEAIQQTLERRGTPLVHIPTVFTEEFAGSKNKQTQWLAFERRIHVTQSVSFESVLARIKAFLSPIYECLLRDTGFFGSWHGAASNSWEKGAAPDG